MGNRATRIYNDNGILIKKSCSWTKHGHHPSQTLDKHGRHVVNISLFGKHKTTADGYQTLCAMCNILRHRNDAADSANKPFELSIEWFINSLNKLNNKCPAIGRDFIPNDRNWTYSVDKMNPKLWYTKANSIIMSRIANTMKSDMLYDEFINVCEEIAINIINKERTSHEASIRY